MIVSVEEQITNLSLLFEKYISLKHKKERKMPSKKNQTAVGQMIQRCHKWRQKRKQYIDQARQTTDEIERERLLQTAEHYGRIVNEEQIKIDSQRDPKDKNLPVEEIAESADNSDAKEADEDEEMGFPDFIANLK